MANYNPRRLMEQAIEVMRQSVAERRDDGKASPFVGAVLWKPDGTVETAFRGELRDGDHAEYTLLERKNHHCSLDGAVLFVTLEPCAPDSRRFPKLGCAERIVLARIKEVWIGIADPDPLVDRKGVRYLQDRGVDVRMFDHDLQEQILVANKEFTGQALDRAAVAREKKPGPITLSRLERAVAAAETGDLSTEAMEQYRTVARLDDQVGSPGFNRRLIQQGLLKEKNGRATPTGFGIVLFGKEPRVVMPQAGLLGTIHLADGTEELKDFDGPQVLVPEQALQWLQDKLPNPIERSAARRRPVNEALFELVREGVVNALVHRDYSIKGAKCQLTVTSATIVVKSPGRPVEPITLEQMQSFNAPMLSRNPVLHYVFARMELAEERGLGLNSMRGRAQEAGLPLPRFSWEAPYLVLTLYGSRESFVAALAPSVRESLTESEQEGLRWLVTRDKAKAAQYAVALGVEDRTARRHLSHFIELGLVSKTGSGPSVEYGVL